MPKPRTIIIALAALALAALPSIALARHGHHQRGRSQATVSGTVAAFQGGVLTVKRADNTTASAEVTPATEFDCEPADSGTAVTARIADHGGADQGQTSSSGRGSDDNPADQADEKAQDPAAEAAEDQRDDDQAASRSAGTGQPACDSTALTVGQTVTRATIRTGKTGAATFKQIKLAV